VHQKNQKVAKYVPREKLGLKEPLIHIHPLMQISLPPNIVKTLITLKSQKAVNERADNGRTQEMVETRLGKDWL